MSDLSSQDQALLRQAEAQRIVDAAMERFADSQIHALAELREMLEKRFALINGDLRELRQTSGLVTQIQMNLSYIERDISSMRRELENQIAVLNTQLDRLGTRLQAVENTQASRSGVYNQMERFLLGILLAAVSAMAAIIGWKGGPG